VLSRSVPRRMRALDAASRSLAHDELRHRAIAAGIANPFSRR